MSLETLLIKLKTTVVSHSFNPIHPLKKKPSFNKSKNLTIQILSFEISSLISKLLHLHRSLSHPTSLLLQNDTLSLQNGIHKLISTNPSFLLHLISSEFTLTLNTIALSLSTLSLKCNDPKIQSFYPVFLRFADSGLDPNRWVLSGHKEIEGCCRKLERYVQHTADLYKNMEELTVLESGLRKSLQLCSSDMKEQKKAYEIQQRIFWKKQELKDLKEMSLWNKSFDSVVLLLVRMVFTLLDRIKHVFDIGNCYPSSLSRSVSASALVYPSDQTQNNNNTSDCTFVSGPLKSSNFEDDEHKNDSVSSGFFESQCSVLLNPAPDTLGASALALHYANLIIVIEKMIKSPHLVGLEARDDLYAMLPNSIRSSLRSRLKGVGFFVSDAVLAGEWRDALGRILGWLSPLAHNMIKWQSERSFEQQNMVQKSNNVLLLQTLFFANREKTEAAITELLVGLNYICRFEREMTAQALFHSANLNLGLLNLQKH